MTRSYKPVHKPRVSFKELSSTLLNWKGVLVNAMDCTDEVFREALKGYQQEEDFSTYEIEERWYLICYSKVPVYRSNGT